MDQTDATKSRACFGIQDGYTELVAAIIRQALLDARNPKRVHRHLSSQSRENLEEGTQKAAIRFLRNQDGMLEELVTLLGLDFQCIEQAICTALGGGAHVGTV